MAENTNIEPIKLYWSHSGTNPTKVVIILEELQIPYQGVFISHDELKTPKYERINPNGRLPAIQDMNTNVILWESGAIIGYLIETYDDESKLTYTTSPERWHLQQWEHFQVSGQGPYFGQAAWFLTLHPEPVESAKTRYINEIRRVAGVIDKWLADRSNAAAKASSEDVSRGMTAGADNDENVWLVGTKCTYVDLSFAAYNGAVSHLMQLAKRPREEWDPETQFPHFWRWQTAMMSRPSFQKAASLTKEEDVHL